MRLHRVLHDIDHPYPPRITTFTKPFWEGLRDGRFVTTRCMACASKTFPPKVACPACWSSEIEWVEPGVTGVLYSWTRVHASPAVFQALAPYALGIVDLDSGIRLACPLVTADADIGCGMRIELAVIEYRDGRQLAARVLGY